MIYFLKYHKGINYHMIIHKTYILKMKIFGELNSKKQGKWINNVITMKYRKIFTGISKN